MKAILEIHLGDGPIKVETDSAVAALVDAIRERAGLELPTPIESITVLAVGTGNDPYTVIDRSIMDKLATKSEAKRRTAAATRPVARKH